jgi:leucyl aminopeptidase
MWRLCKGEFFILSTYTYGAAKRLKASQNSRKACVTSAMTTLSLTSSLKDDILVVGLAQGPAAGKGGKPSLVIESGDVALDVKSLEEILTDMGATGKADEVIKIPGNSVRLLVFTGLGKATPQYGHELLRRAAGAASRALVNQKSATFALPAKDLDGVSAVAQGAALGAYLFNDFRSDEAVASNSPLAAAKVYTSHAAKQEFKDAAVEASVIAQYTFLTRDLINTPPSHLNPATFAERMSAEVKAAGGARAGLSITVMTETALKSKGYGGITAVGQGSANPPRLVRISYTPTGKRKPVKKYAFVGKGITFDSGGLALKPALGMEAMKSDMSGAAAVCSAVLAIASLKLPVAVDAWAPLAENMVSDNATRPSDIITIYGGKTVEVLNPDAEGRLVLADALQRAQEEKNLDAIFDIATLTGAQVVALGTRTSAVMTNNESLSQAFLSVTQDTGEQFWPMPLPTELRASLDSPVADLANIGDRMGGMLVAGIFLKEFVADELPWLHLDIAGPAYNDRVAHGYTPVGGTGIGVRSLVAAAKAQI